MLLSALLFTIVGGAFGNGLIGLAGKYWLKPNIGASAYLGNFGILQQFRANFEMDIFPVRDTEFGRFDLYWLAGIDAGVWLPAGVAIGKFGVGAGVGVDLKFHDDPVDAFLDVGLGYFPVDYCTAKTALPCLLGPRMDLGARYYFF
jgi:hypothetical protein